MATTQLPHTPSAPSRKSVFSPGSSSRRPSISSGSGMQIPQGIGYSPGSTMTPTTPAGSGIPALRTLRSLLPFGPHKNQNATSTSSLSPHPSKSPFSSFGSVRRSMTRERKTSLSNDVITPVIAIGGPLADETAIRRSASLSRIEKPLPREPNYEGVFGDEHGVLGTAFTLRTPSPGPPLAAELSTIMEADSSGVSKNLPDSQSQSASKPQLETPRPPNHLSRSESIDFDLDLSTTEVANQVRDALKKSTASSQSGKEWLKPDKAVVIIDGDEHPDAVDKSFNVDPDLAALLTANGGSRNGSSHSLHRTPTTPTFPSSPSSRLPRARQASSFLPRLRPSPSSSPNSPRFSIPSPSPTSPPMSTATTPRPSPEKGPAVAVSGYGHSPTSPPVSPSSPSASTSTPAARRTLTAPRSPSLFNPPSSRVFSGLLRNREDRTPSQAKENSNSSRAATRTLRQVMLGASRGKDTSASVSGDSSSFPSPQQVTPLGRGSLDSRRPPAPASLGSELGLGRPSLDIRRSSFDSRARPRGSTSPERVSERGMAMTERELEFTPSFERDATFEDTPYRPSFDSTGTRPSFDTSSRPGSVARLRERERDRAATPSLRVTDTTAERMSPIPCGPPSSATAPRTRKRSMSVQERIAKGRHGNGHGLASENGGHGAAIARPASSLSAHNGRRTYGEEVGGYESPVGMNGTGPVKMEWLGPRTAKAFKAAGLLDFDRDRGGKEKEKEKESGDGLYRFRDRSSSVSATGPSPSPLGASASSISRFGSTRSTSEYNPGHNRAQSRMAYSEVGGVSAGGSARRGSGTFSAYGGGGGGSSYGGNSPYGYQGLMESPTFTVSSSSRERDTPKSVSTAPTSLSESFGYLGRDRTDREREEVRELKEKHGTEMGALLGALSDAQRTVRLLREENAQLRERLERASGVLQENNDLRHALDSVERESSGLRRELAALRAIKASPGLTPSWSGSSGGSSGLRTPVPKQGNSSPLAMDSTPSFIRHNEEPEQGEELFNDTIIIHDNIDDQNGGYESSDEEVAPEGDFLPSTLTPSLKRRRSDTSSIFPVPPSNMTMLLYDETTSNLVDGNRTTADQSQYPFSFPTPNRQPGHLDSTSSKPKPKPIAMPQALHHSHSRSLSQTQTQLQTQPITYRNFAGPGHVNNKSVTSTTSISPTIANFSMVTGSPGSLFLRPEHEILLGDMESLDLGSSGPDSEPGNRFVASEDGW